MELEFEERKVPEHKSPNLKQKLANKNWVKIMEERNQRKKGWQKLDCWKEKWQEKKVVSMRW